MRRFLVFFLPFALSLFLTRALVTDAAVPPRPEQPHSDIFEAVGITNMQLLNPVTIKAKAQRTVAYRLLVMPGCITGSIESDMRAVETESKTVGLTLVRNDSAYDSTIRLNCGSEQIRICGGVNFYCLGRGFPYTPDVDLSDIMYTPGSVYPIATRVSIMLHEIFGHMVGTWNEQYCSGTETSGICQGIPRFGSAPGWVDFMSTGPNSRGYFTAIPLERVARTLWEDPPCIGNPCWDGQMWVFTDGWKFKPNSGCGEWVDPKGILTWGACDPSWGGRYNIPLAVWFCRPPQSCYFNPATNGWYSIYP